MPEATVEAVPVVAGGSSSASSESEVRSALASAVLAVPGVVRLEPTLSTAGPSILLRHDPADGLHLLLRTGDVDVNLATSSSHQARAVAHEVHAVVASTLALHGHQRGAVTVSILTIDE